LTSGLLLVAEFLREEGDAAVIDCVILLLLLLAKLLLIWFKVAWWFPGAVDLTDIEWLRFKVPDGMGLGIWKSRISEGKRLRSKLELVNMHTSTTRLTVHTGSQRAW
jgi:hypothetical protein